MEVERDGIGSSRDHRRQHQRPGDHDPVAAGSAEPAQAAVPAAPAGTAAMRGTRQARRSGASGDAIAWSPTRSRESRPLEDERAIVRIAAPGRLRLGESASPLLAARSLIQTIALSPMRSPAPSCPGDRIPSKAIVPRPPRRCWEITREGLRCRTKAAQADRASAPRRLQAAPVPTGALAIGRKQTSCVNPWRG